MSKINRIPASRYRDMLHLMKLEIEDRNRTIAHLAQKAEAYDMLRAVLIPGSTMVACEDILRVINDELDKTPSHVEPNDGED